MCSEAKTAETFIALKKAPFNKFCGGNMVWINKYEFAVAGQTSHDDCYEINDDESDAENGIFVYNIKSNEWKLLIKYPKGFTTSCHSICYNPNTKILYLYGDEANMININLSSKQFNIVKSCSKYVGQGPVLLNIDNKCHVIAGSDNKDHLIWDDNKHEFETIFTFPKWGKGIHGHGVVYSKYRNSLYLFGGYDYGGTSDNYSIWKCELNNNNQWSVLSINLPFLWYYSAYILTPNENYIVLFKSNSKIYLFDLNEEVLYQLVMVGINADHAVLCGDKSDEILICGYIHCISKKLDILIPYELMGLVQKYYTSEHVYLTNYQSAFYKIHLKDILSAEKQIVIT